MCFMCSVFRLFKVSNIIRKNSRRFTHIETFTEQKMKYPFLKYPFLYFFSVLLRATQEDKSHDIVFIFNLVFFINIF